MKRKIERHTLERALEAIPRIGADVSGEEIEARLFEAFDGRSVFEAEKVDSYLRLNAADAPSYSYPVNVFRMSVSSVARSGWEWRLGHGSRCLGTTSDGISIGEVPRILLNVHDAIYFYQYLRLEGARLLISDTADVAHATFRAEIRRGELLIAEGVDEFLARAVTFACLGALCDPSVQSEACAVG